MTALVPLRVSIGLKAGGGHAFPDFNTLAVVVASSMDWSVYVDKEGLGWHYDQCCGHVVDTVDSPMGTWLGLLLVPRAFADEAIAAFPAECSELTDATARTFWEGHATSQDSDEDIDLEVLQGIEQKQRLALTLTAEQLRAIDPADDTPGIRPNKRKLWDDYKTMVGMTIAPRAP